MTGRILILGAAGRLGHAAAEAFRDAGWTVLSFVRPGADSRAAPGTTVVEGDALDPASVLKAASGGVDVVLNALNPPFKDWRAQSMPFLEVSIAAAKAAGATLIFPGNVYGYGKKMPDVIDENTPMQPTTPKGAIRVVMEQRLQEASEQEGLRTIILRAGDFFGGEGRGSWFDLVVVRDIRMAVVRYPGPLDVMHSWAYLPDLAQTMVQLADRRDTLNPFETFCFPGQSVTGAQMLSTLQKIAEQPLKLRSFPWLALRIFSLFSNQLRELVEVAYLWRIPHRLSGDKLRATIGDIPQTTFRESVHSSLDALFGFGGRHAATKSEPAADEAAGGEPPDAPPPNTSPQSR